MSTQSAARCIYEYPNGAACELTEGDLVHVAATDPAIRARLEAGGIFDKGCQPHEFLRKQSCGVCAGLLVAIRSMVPHGKRRVVCPTCLAERMDLIRQMADRDYGKAYVSAAIPKIIVEAP